MNISDITKEDFYKYEEVRRYSKLNVFHPDARMLTGLTKTRYLFILENYRELLDRYPIFESDSDYKGYLKLGGKHE